MPPSPIQSVLFDMDGVLVDSFEVWVPVLADAARELGMPPVTREDVVASWGQGIQEDIAQYYPGVTVDALSELYDRFFRSHLDQLVVINGAVDVLTELKRRGIPTAVVTNSPRDLCLNMLDVAHLKPDHVVSGTDVAAPKPAPDMVTRACELLGVPPGSSLMIGDTPYDAQAAKAAGVRFVGYRMDAETRVDGMNGLLGLI